MTAFASSPLSGHGLSRSRSTCVRTRCARNGFPWGGQTNFRPSPALKNIETFISEQGYTVNVLQDTVSEEQQARLPDDFVPITHVVFVADGIKYTLRGRVPVQAMKDIVNAMQY